MEPDVLDWSALWTPELFGNPRGEVTTGFARGWITPLRTLNRDGELGSAVIRVELLKYHFLSVNVEHTFLFF